MFIVSEITKYMYMNFKNFWFLSIIITGLFLTRNILKWRKFHREKLCSIHVFKSNLWSDGFYSSFNYNSAYRAGCILQRFIYFEIDTVQINNVCCGIRGRPDIETWHTKVLMTAWDQNAIRFSFIANFTKQAVIFFNHVFWMFNFQVCIVLFVPWFEVIEW